MKKLTKLVAILMAFMLVMLPTFALADTQVAKEQATMTLVKDDKADVKFGKYGEFTKSKSDFNATNKTIDITLTVKNNAEKAKQLPGEVVLLIDSSGSMDKNKVTIDGTEMTRKQAVLSAANTLINKLYEIKPDIKIGIAEYATAKDAAKRGTMDDAFVNTALTSNKDTVTSGLSNVGKHDFFTQTDIEAGIDTAKSMFSKDTTSKKYIILLTDGIPNVSLGKYASEDKHLYYYEREQFDATKKALTDATSKGYNIISGLIDMLTDTVENSVTLKESNSTSTDEEIQNMTKKEAVEYIFGTQDAPTTGMVFNVADKNIITVISENIFDALVGEVYSLTDINIDDVIPDNIYNNFNVSFISFESSVKGKGNKIDTTAPDIEYNLVHDKAAGSDTAKMWDAKYTAKNKTINLKLDVLDPQETCTLVYRLTLKDKFSSDILDKDLPTNKNVTINYSENGKAGTPVTTPKCPAVKLTIPKVAKPIPQTGTKANTIILSVVVLGTVLAIAIVSIVNYKKNSL